MHTPSKRLLHRIPMALILATLLGGSPFAQEGDPADTQEPPPLAAQEQVEAPVLDALGDPLPAGAVQRLGTLRLRHDGLVALVALASAEAGGVMISASSDRSVRLWHPESGHELARLDVGDATPHSGVLLEGGRRLVIASQDRSVRLWDLEAMELLVTWEELGFHVSASPDGARLAFSRAAEGVQVVQVATFAGVPEAEVQLELSGEYSVTSTAWSPDGSLLAALAENRAKSLRRAGTAEQPSCVIHLWDAATGEERGRVVSQEDWLRAPSFSADGSRLWSGTTTGELVSWTVEDGAEVARLEVDGSSIFAVRVSPDGRLLAASTESGLLRLLDAESGETLRDVPIGLAAAQTLAFSPESDRIAVGAGVVLGAWDCHRGNPIYSLARHIGGVSAVAFSPDGRLVATGGYDRVVRLWERGSARLLRSLVGHVGPIYAVRFARDGSWLATGGLDGVVRLWDPETGEVIRDLTGHKKAVSDIDVSPDGALILSASADQTLRLWSAENGELIRTFEGLRGLFAYARFSPDGREVLSAASDIRIWNLETGEERARIEGFGPMATCAALSADGSILATGHADRAIRLWNTADASSRHRLLAHKGRLTGLAFAPTGLLLVSASSSDPELRLWDADSGAARATLAGHHLDIMSVATDPTGGAGGPLVSGSQDGTALIWAAVPVGESSN